MAVIDKVSPFAPESLPDMPEIAGVRFRAVAAGLRYQGRKDLLLAVLDEGAVGHVDQRDLGDPERRRDGGVGRAAGLAGHHVGGRHEVGGGAGARAEGEAQREEGRGPQNLTPMARVQVSWCRRLRTPRLPKKASLRELVSRRHSPRTQTYCRGANSTPRLTSLRV